MPYLVCRDEDKLALGEPAGGRGAPHPYPIQPLCLRSQPQSKVPFTGGWLQQRVNRLSAPETPDPRRVRLGAIVDTADPE